LFSCLSHFRLILAARESKPKVVVGTVVGANYVAVAGNDADVVVLAGDDADVVVLAGDDADLVVLAGDDADVDANVVEVAEDADANVVEVAADAAKRSDTT
jgi:hypothetical protein